MNKITIRMIVTSFVILLFISGCQDDKAVAELDAFRAKLEIEEQNLELVRQAWTEWNNRNIEFFMEVYDSAEYVYYSPIDNPNPESREEVIEIVKKAWKEMPDVTLNVKELMATGDKVISTMTYSGTHTQEFNGIPATGNKIEVSGINIVRIKDGKIIEERENVDALGMMIQLGMELKPKE